MMFKRTSPQNQMLCMAALGIFASSPLAYAQTITGSVSGTVMDSAGAVVPHAKITVANTQTGVVSTTEASGSGVYNVRFLQIGQYTVTVEAPGFASRKPGPFALEASQDAKFDATLGVSGSTQTVDVSASLVPLLNTENAELGTTLDTTAIDAVPLHGRNFSSLTIFTPGAVATNPTGFTGANAIERSTGGSRRPRYARRPHRPAPVARCALRARRLESNSQADD